MSWISLSDTDRAYYVETGTGTPLVFVSGWGGDASNWVDDMAFFGRHFRCIAVDHPGIAGQPLPESTFSTQDMADRIVQALRALKIERAHILGHSMGGAVAQYIAIRHPDIVERLVLCGTFARLDNRSARVIASCGELMQNCDEDAAMRMIYWLIFGAQFYETHLDTIDTLFSMRKDNPIPHGVFVYQTETCLSHDSREHLGKIQSPTLITHGTADILMSPSLGEAVANMIPDATLFSLDNAGHSHLWEYSTTWRKRVMAFLLGEA
ncbi:alpha/beta fold hydrolase [Desulfovibrio inopinatus]|uniref:alpha/beta fold hydrolase n=1 Tax=Desulfovibrio inopinatus TaxID=102109 RepID=UPI0003F8A8F9|nr:alpha/beta fold hydrolase [Desulfovibrio inopinatus]